MSRNEPKLQIMPPSAGYYPVDDMPAYIEKIVELTKPKTRKVRKDLEQGMVCIVTDGQHISKRVIYLGNKTTEKHISVCIGPASINGAGLFAIDERFLFKTSYIFSLSSLNITEQNINDAKDCSMSLVHVEENQNTSDFEKSIESNILKQVAQVKHLKSYLKESFKIPEGDALSFKF